MIPAEPFGVIMKNFQLYVGGVNDITYRYDIQKAGDIFNVRIFSVTRKNHIEEGVKNLRNITAQDVIDECSSHYHRKAKSIRGFLSWLGIK
jgi:hypothetical protein